jgi:hypothetical protein
VDVDCPSARLLVVTDTLNRSWKASVDGKPAPLLRADVMFRGVWLDPGRHQVTMEFDRARMFPYLAASLLSWLGVGVVFLFLLIRSGAKAKLEP